MDVLVVPDLDIQEVIEKKQLLRLSEVYRGRYGVRLKSTVTWT